TGGPVSATCNDPAGSSGSGDFDSSPAHFALGTTTVTCTATDAGGTSSGSGTVTVQDTTPPSFGSPSGTTGTTNTPGGTAVVNYTPPAATDLGQTLAVNCTPAPGSPFPIGSTPVHCSASDGRGNSAGTDFDVVVTLVDNQPPTFTQVPSSPITREATGPGGASVAWTITATDNIDP